MTKPVIIWRTWDYDKNRMVLRVDVSYVPSFCEHLRNKGVYFIPDDGQKDDWGMDRQKNHWEIKTNEIVIKGIHDPVELLEGWEIPQGF